MTHFCNCHAISPSPAALSPFVSLGIHSPSSSARHHLTLLLHAHDIPVHTEEQVAHIGVQDFSRLLGVLDGLSEADRLSLRAVPYTAEGPNVWEVQPLSVWADRLNSEWFESATENLVFYGQPIVEVHDGRVIGYEALVRARLGDELIGAGPLLKAAAAHDQMRAFDALARTTAIRQLYGKLAPAQSLFINFAPGVIYNPDICLQTTFQACREVGADFSRLVFEITEGEDFPDLELLKSILERYRQEGARVALDDLGSGHTSLVYLAELKPDIVKLDRALIQGLSPSKPAFRLVRSLVDYAHDLGIQVVAEGIEEPEELVAAREAGVDLVQGYYLGRPAETLSGVSSEAAGWWEVHQ
ncbi:EAL domain-containing protein [Deinococcus altitudinis]|uniref:EAL domain-containing protein n=1 Tax=Deinococcus altitudinis TaxID=468914 RepID=UPI0038926F93